MNIQPRYALLGSITLCLLVLLLMGGCSTIPATPARTDTVIWRGCDGKDHAAIVRVFTGFAPAMCPARAWQLGYPGHALMYAGGMTAGCLFVSPPDADRIRYAELYALPIESVIAHELEHLHSEHPGRVSGDEYREADAGMEHTCEGKS